MAAVFRTSDSGEPAYILRPRGLDPAREYRVTLDNSGGTFHATGRELARDGISVRLEQPLSSELVLIEVVG